MARQAGEYRIVRLYRPIIGNSWWLQRGYWMDSDGAHFVATGRGRRTFRVEWEENYQSKEAAQSRLERLGTARVLKGAEHEKQT